METALLNVLNANQAAKFLGVSPWTVYEYCRQGVLPHKKLGRRVLISRARLEEWVKSDKEDG